jgi:hypothetical protein
MENSRPGDETGERRIMDKERVLTIFAERKKLLRLVDKVYLGVDYKEIQFNDKYRLDFSTMNTLGIIALTGAKWLIKQDYCLDENNDLGVLGGNGANSCAFCQRHIDENGRIDCESCLVFIKTGLTCDTRNYGGESLYRKYTNARGRDEMLSVVGAAIEFLVELYIEVYDESSPD